MNKSHLVLSCWFLFASNSFAAEAESITVETLTKSTSSWDGRALPKYPAGTPEITILKITIPPGMSLPLHKHPVINAGVILSGTLRVSTEENRTITLKAGDSLVEVVNKWHYGENVGTEPVEIVVFYAGVEKTPLTITQ